MDFSALADITNGKVIQQPHPRSITQLTIDSRKITAGKGVLFIAIKGPNHDGHDYIAELYQRKIFNFIVESSAKVTLNSYPEANFLQVENSITALQKIAAAHRQKFGIPVIGITGSNGKTIVKEWLSEMLSEHFNLLKSPKSFNSQVGVPLSVWPLHDRHQLAIFEAGISQPAEMAKLENIIKPTIGIFTNIGSAHDEGFQARADKVIEKTTLFKQAEIIIYCRDYELIHQQMIKIDGQKTLSWSTTRDADIRVNKIISNDKTILSFQHLSRNFSFVVPFIDKASLENCIHCLISMLYLGISAETIQTKLHLLKRISMRLELKQGINDCQIIDDSYNNDLAGLEIALQFLQQQKQKPRKSIILSDILQSGLPKEDLYKKVAQLLNSQRFEKLIGIGPELMKYADYFENNSSFYPNTQSFLLDIINLKFDRENILIKGARIYEFEKIVVRLQQKIHNTVLEINLDALTHNLNFYRSQLKPTTKVMVMVKAFAYGSGLGEVANLLQYHRVDYLGVAYTDEGVALRENGIRLPIMVMNPAPDDFSRMLQYQLEPEVYNQQLLERIVDFSLSVKEKIKIHLKIDTGMRRLGFESTDVAKLITTLQNSDYISIASIFSHLVGADDEQHDEFSHLQASAFTSATSKILAQTGQKPLLHLLNSPGIVRFPQYHFDMVRLGIGLYGIESAGIQQDELQPISCLKTRISQIKQISAGETVGYSRHGKTNKNATIATIAIGYADGYQRAFSNGKGEVLVNGHRAKVIGNVCMDMTMVDITNIPAEEGDEVIIFGKELTIAELAAKISTISYEILTNVSERVKRVFFTE
jgi:Alr-MurF fusion protein